MLSISELEAPGNTNSGRAWAKVRVGLFRQRLNVRGRSSGDYLLIPRQFRTEYVSWFEKNCKLPNDADELAAALKSAHDGAEVFIRDDEWANFINRKGLGNTEHSVEPSKSSQGLSENNNWLAIMIEVSVDLLRSAAADERPVGKHVAEAALKRVTPRDKSVLPKVDTVAEQVRAIVRQHWK